MPEGNKMMAFMASRRLQALLAVAVLAVLGFVSFLLLQGHSSQNIPVQKQEKENSNIFDDLLNSVKRNDKDEIEKCRNNLVSLGDTGLPFIKDSLFNKAHPRVKLICIHAAREIGTSSSVLILKEYAEANRPFSEDWLQVTAIENIKNMENNFAKKTYEEIIREMSSQIRDTGKSFDSVYGSHRKMYKHIDAEKLDSLDYLANILENSDKREARLESIDALGNVNNNESNSILIKFVVKSRFDDDKEWEVNRSIRILIDNQESNFNVLNWLKSGDAKFSQRIIEVASRMKSSKGLVFLIKAKEVFPDGNILRIKTEAAISRYDENAKYDPK